MNTHQLVQEALAAGVKLRLVDGKVRLRGPSDAVAAVTEKLRPHRHAIAQYLAADVVGEFTPWCPPISPAAVDELHRLIAQFAERFRLTERETAEIIATAKRMPAADVPRLTTYFQNSIREKS